MVGEMLGNQLLKLASSAKENIVFVAPFIKFETLRRIMDVIPNQLLQVDCVTRWHSEDIVDGVCDLEIFDLFAKRTNARLWRHPNLHAKYFRGDESCLVGSANLTGRALGWRLPCNLELIVELDRNFPGLKGWEDSLMRSSVLVTRDLRDQLAREAELLALQRPKMPSMDVECDDDPNYQWMPLCPTPKKLFKVYSGALDEGKMVSSAFELAQRDLRTLGPPKGYSEEDFLCYVADRLQELEVIRKVVAASDAGLSDVQAADMIADYIDTSLTIDPDDAWNILKCWMMHFFPEKYRIEVGQEILVKSRTISQE